MITEIRLLEPSLEKFPEPSARDLASLEEYSKNLFNYMQTVPCYNGPKRQKIFNEYQRVNRFIKQQNKRC